MVMAGLLLIGSVWGTTNALIKRGALIAQERERDCRAKEGASAEAESSLSGAISWVVSFVREWFQLLCVWEYSIPFLVNLSASILFFRALGDSPINIAVPVTNATTFAFTALAGYALGEHIDISKTIAGISMIVLGIALCIAPGIIL